MIFGHSQGGGAALFAAEQAATWAPELHVVGTAAGAPAGDLDTIVPLGWSEAAITNPYAGSAIDGLAAGYPDLSLDAVANAAGQAALAKVATECVGSIDLTPEQAGAKNPMDDPAWKAAVDANTAGNVVPSAPVLIFHGEADTTVLPAWTDITLSRYCAIGATVEVEVVPRPGPHLGGHRGARRHQGVLQRPPRRRTRRHQLLTASAAARTGVTRRLAERRSTAPAGWRPAAPRPRWSVPPWSAPPW